MNWILECINLLRSRKSRPDLERICRTMQKCHGIDERDTEEDLSVLIASGIVTKRSFKGAISYRNASGWHRVLGSGKVSRAARWVGEAIRALDRGYGVSAVDIEKFITARHPYYHNLKARIKIALKEDLDHGRIWCVSDGMYRLLESAEVGFLKHEILKPYTRDPSRYAYADCCRKFKGFPNMNLPRQSLPFKAKSSLLLIALGR